MAGMFGEEVRWLCAHKCMHTLVLNFGVCIFAHAYTAEERTNIVAVHVHNVVQTPSRLLFRKDVNSAGD